MKLLSCWDYYGALEHYSAELLALTTAGGTFVSPTLPPLHAQVSLKLSQLRDDLLITEGSFSAKDALDSKGILKATIKYAANYYRAREYEIFDLLKQISTTLDERLPDKMLRLGTKLQEGLHTSFNALEGFKNPYPTYLFFSQAKHGGFFSGKALRGGVSGEPVVRVAEKLSSGEVPADYLRVNIYLAPFRGQIHPFVYNNRTWVAFSRAHVDASRIVPQMATQDLLNRVNKLDEVLAAGAYPNVIVDEDAPEGAHEAALTTSGLPGPKF